MERWGIDLSLGKEELNLVFSMEELSLELGKEVLSLVLDKAEVMLKGSVSWPSKWLCGDLFFTQFCGLFSTSGIENYLIYV